MVVNGKEIKLDSPVTLSQFIENKGLNKSLIVVELNHEIPDKDSWDEIILNDADNLEILKFIGGG